MKSQVNNSVDVIVVGAGIVGLAVARALKARAPSLRLSILEKEHAVARHQTGHNSGVLHTGIYYKPGSLKAETCRQGRAEMIEFCQAEGILHEICGKLIVATRPEELLALGELESRAGKNRVRAERVARRELVEIEPHVGGIAGLFVPDAGIVDYVEVAERLKERLKEAGTAIHFGAEVKEFSARGRDIIVETLAGRFTCRFVVSCAGLQSDRIAELGGVPSDVRIVPFRGEYYELSHEARGLVRNLIYPVPRPEFPFLGIHFTRGVHGDVECGPNAVLNLGRETYEKTQVNLTDLSETLLYPGFLRLFSKYHRLAANEMLRSYSRAAFLESARALVPALEAGRLQRAKAGIRAQAVSRNGALVDDFLLAESEYLLCVVNAPSPAATASLQIGHHIARRVENALRDRVALC